MTPSNTNTNHPPSFAAMVPSDYFTFTANAKPISAPGTSSTIVKTSEAPTTSLRSAFNAAAPANHLPTELVVKILMSGAWSQWWQLVTLSHICQHWRNVALGTPQLWADAVQAGLIMIMKERPLAKLLGRPSWRPMFLFLPTLLTRSAPCPLRIELPRAECLTSLVEHDALNPHFSRLAHLSIQVKNADDVAKVLQIVRSHVRNVEILHMPQVNRSWGSAPISIDELPSWEDTDLPHLHTLAIPGHCFTGAIAVASLKTLVLSDGPRSHDVFLAALHRCSLALESLTLHHWAHPERASRLPDSTARTVQLQNLRRLKVALHTERPDMRPPTLLFAALSFSPRVAIEIDWHCNPGNTRQLLPKHLVGLHAPPFFDSMYLHLFGHPHTASLHCYVGHVENLCVRERPMLDRFHHNGRRFGEFLDEHRYPTVTQLAVDLDMDAPDAYTPLARGDLLSTFVGAFPSLRRLDLLGKNIRDAKLQMAKAFLDLSDHPPAAPGAGRTLGYVCTVSEQDKVSDSVGFVDGLRAQLDELEALLTAHLAEGGPRLHRLELCITYSPRIPHPPPLVYPYTRDVSPSTDLTTYLSSIYLPRFRTLVDEVVFIGDVKKRGPAYRILTGAARQLPGPKRLGQGEKSTTASWSAQKGR